MVKRYWALFLVIGMCGALIAVPRLASELFAFVFIGMVPYSTYMIPTWIMLLIDLTLLLLVLRWFNHQMLLMTNSHKRDTKKRQLARARVQRYTKKQDLARKRALQAFRRTEQKTTRRRAPVKATNT